MNWNLFAAAGVIWALSGAAVASEMGSEMGSDIGSGSAGKGNTGSRTPSDRKSTPAKRDTAEPRKKESSSPPVQPTPAESKTPEEATARAADRKAPSGALIIDTPSGKLP